MIGRYKIDDLELDRGEKKKNKFLIKRDNTVKSLKEVEFFLGNWKRVVKGIKLYKILKWKKSSSALLIIFYKNIFKWNFIIIKSFVFFTIN